MVGLSGLAVKRKRKGNKPLRGPCFEKLSYVAGFDPRNIHHMVGFMFANPRVPTIDED